LSRWCRGQTSWAEQRCLRRRRGHRPECADSPCLRRLAHSHGQQSDHCRTLFGERWLRCAWNGSLAALQCRNVRVNVIAKKPMNELLKVTQTIFAAEHELALIEEA